MDRADLIFRLIFRILAPFIFAGIFGFSFYLMATEQERDIEKKAKVCEIERQNNMKLDDFCIGE